MEKVKLTREQANAIEYLKKLLSDTSERKRNLQLIKEKLDHDYNWESPNFKAANEIPDDIFIAALHYGYEVEPEFKVGDWAVWRSMEGIDVIKQIEKVEGYRIWADWLDEGSLLFAPSDEIRHATPEEIETEKERRWWAKHGREVWELKCGDILSFHESLEVYNIEEVGHNFIFVNGANGKVRYKLEQVKKLFKIACFAEDRKDIGDN